MDRNFHNDEFERLLREKSNEFRMYPSKRIWHSIYNNIHPGRKWPSVAMSITLITALLLIGYLNTRNTNLYIVTGYHGINTSEQKTITESKYPQFISQVITNDPVATDITRNKTISNGRSFAPSDIHLKSNTISDKSEATSASSVPMLSKSNQLIIQTETNHANSNIINNIYSQSVKEVADPMISGINSFPALQDVQIESASKYDNVTDDDRAGILASAQQIPVYIFAYNILAGNDVKEKDFEKKINIDIQEGNTSVIKSNLATNKRDFISSEDKEWIENYALYNRPATKKWANKLAWQVYATPSVVYRQLYNDPNFGNTVNTTPLANTAILDINNAVKQKPSIGLEIGTGIQYSIFRGVKLKAGIQLNYTRYNSNAFQNTHPVATKLTMHDFTTNLSYELYRTTPFSNKSGLEATKLHNETYQVSLPLGADMKLAGNDNIQWNIGVTVQPTYVAGGKSYLISSDRRNYVKESSMLNRWNLNAGFETFISFKSSNGLTFQLGPQFRTQLFTTNSKKFAVEERLLNYGIKFGISKNIK